MLVLIIILRLVDNKSGRCAKLGPSCTPSNRSGNVQTGHHTRCITTATIIIVIVISIFVVVPLVVKVLTISISTIIIIKRNIYCNSNSNNNS